MGRLDEGESEIHGLRVLDSSVLVRSEVGKRMTDMALDGADKLAMAPNLNYPNHNMASSTVQLFFNVQAHKRGLRCKCVHVIRYSPMQCDVILGRCTFYDRSGVFSWQHENGWPAGLGRQASSVPWSRRDTKNHLQFYTLLKLSVPQFMIESEVTAWLGMELSDDEK